tara:strand:- start:4896 stop:5699 length:804 start_codon:yes stop_codon:yes gene_type:complete
MEVKTKIAYTINGLVSGISGKNSAKNSDEDRLLVLKYVSNLLNKNIINKDVDVFIFSWHTNFESHFNEYLNPTRIKLMSQIDFPIPIHLRSGNTGRVFAYKSRWYGFKEVMQLVTDYENENNFKYDLVVNNRFDICWHRNYDFSKLNTNQFHIPLPCNRPTWGWPDENPEISDHLFASNSDWMKNYSTLYDKIDEYTLPGQCPQWNTISNHFLMVWHLRKLGLLTNDIVKKSFRSLHHGDTNINTNMDIEIDYDIFRFRKLNKDNLK